MASLGIIAQTSVHAELQRTPSGWNNELRQKWRLAPKNAVISQEEYDRECEKIGRFGGEAITANLDGDLVMVLTIGALREWPFFVRQVNERGTSVSACDWATVPCNEGKEFFNRLPLATGVYNRVRKVDLEVLFENIYSPLPIPEKKKTLAQRDMEKAKSAYAGQAVQVLDEIGKNVFMRGLGKWLADCPGRKAVLVHPFPENNTHKDIVWGYTTPYSLNELLTPAEAGARRKLQVSGLDNQVIYFKLHTYSTLILSS